MSHKETPIGRIPEDWKVVRLGDVLTFKNGERPELSENGNFPVYGANGIMGYSKEYLVDNDFTVVIGRVGGFWRSTSRNWENLGK